MKAAEIPRALGAAQATAAALGLRADDACVLHDSSRIAVRLTPCDVLARVAPVAHPASRGAAFEVEVARRLAAAGCPVAPLDPRVEPGVHERDGFTITLWTYFEPEPRELAPREYADALARLHAGMRGVELRAPHFTDRVADAQALIDDPARTPELPDAERHVLGATLQGMTRAIQQRGVAEQLLHGEPHPGNLLATEHGPRFIDLETCCRGPREFDLAHAPDTVDAHAPFADRALLRDCRTLVLAMITTWRWDHEDDLPEGRQRGAEWFGQLQGALRNREAGSTEPHRA